MNTDDIGLRLKALSNQFPFLGFTGEEERRIRELLAELETIFENGLRLQKSKAVNR